MIVYLSLKVAYFSLFNCVKTLSLMLATQTEVHLNLNVAKVSAAVRMQAILQCSPKLAICHHPSSTTSLFSGHSLYYFFSRTTFHQVGDCSCGQHLLYCTLPCPLCTSCFHNFDTATFQFTEKEFRPYLRQDTFLQDLLLIKICRSGACKIKRLPSVSLYCRYVSPFSCLFF